MYSHPIIARNLHDAVIPGMPGIQEFRRPLDSRRNDVDAMSRDRPCKSVNYFWALRRMLLSEIHRTEISPIKHPKSLISGDDLNIFGVKNST